LLAVCWQGDVIFKLKSQIILLAGGTRFGHESQPHPVREKREVFRKKFKKNVRKCPEACQQNCQQN
jgi:hypothetical protein